MAVQPTNQPPTKPLEEPDDWCDAIQGLLDAPVGKRIESHAVELLSRALNSRPPIAFVGAGASMAYGRISWRDAVIAMQRRVLGRVEVLEKAQPKPHPSLTPQVRMLKELAERHSIDGNPHAKASDYLVAFQLAEQLDRALPPDPDVAPSSPKQSEFREQVMKLLRDEYGHAREILLGAIPKGREDPLLLDRTSAVEGQTTYPGHLGSLDYYRRLHAEASCWINETPDAEALTTILSRLHPTEIPSSGSQDAMLRPYHRFLIGVLLRLIPEKARLAALNAGGERPIWIDGIRAREKLIPRERDPLRLLYDNGITRYLTTNYDHEIERLFQDEGLRRDEPTQASQDELDQLSRSWRELVFDRDTVGQLLAFAARDGRRVAEVVHLHGRAETNGRITVTTADYQERYMTLDDRRQGMEDALAAAFGGNPILFVGSGMGEDDLLRPLRQFVGDKTPNPGRLAIALVPADKAVSDAELDKIGHLQRYGVYTIHFGWTRKAADRPDPSHAINYRSPWLYRLFELKKRLDGLLIRFGENGRAPRADQADLDAFLEAHFFDADTSSDAVTGALDKEDNPTGITPRQLEGISCADHPGLSVAFEQKIFDEIIRLLRSTRRLKRAEAKRISDALRYALVGCLDSIIGAFLCARLIRLREEWAEWRAEWLLRPEVEDPQ